jgi:hypothetical protein
MLAECRLIVPTSYGPGLPIAAYRFGELEDRLVELAGGLTRLPGEACGVWRAPSGELVQDDSRVYLVAIPAGKAEELRELVAELGRELLQECVYLSVAGWAELVPAKKSAEVNGRTLATVGAPSLS